MARRILAELKKVQTFDFSASDSASIDVEIDERDVTRWQVALSAPNDSLYAGGVFLLKLFFPPDYPHSPPELIFETPIYHPNISRKGLICLGILKSSGSSPGSAGGWSPQKSVVDIFTELFALLKNPNPDDPLEVRIAREFTSDPEKFRSEVRWWVKEHASP